MKNTDRRIAGKDFVESDYSDALPCNTMERDAWITRVAKKGTETVDSDFTRTGDSMVVAFYNKDGSVMEILDCQVRRVLWEKKT